MLTSKQAKGAASTWRYTIGSTAKEVVTDFVTAHAERLERVERKRATDKGPGTKPKRVGSRPIRKFIEGLLSKPDRPFLWIKLEVTNVPSVTEKSGYVTVSSLLFFSSHFNLTANLA